MRGRRLGKVLWCVVAGLVVGGLVLLTGGVGQSAEKVVKIGNIEPLSVHRHR